MAQLVPVRCVVCSEPTGTLVDADLYGSLSIADQTCSNCENSEATPQVLPVCDDCGASSMHIIQTRVFDAEFAIEDDGVTRYAYPTSDALVADEIVVRCNNCGHRHYPGEDFTTVEW